MANEFTPRDQGQRDAALDPRASVIVQAPAGSGKTGLLTQRFLRLLAEVEQPEEIVAITFTRKAAAEMRERILGAMEKAANGNAARTPNERKTDELAQAALAADERCGWRLLENPARLRITTIDSFNAMLTRQMPVSSGLGQQPAIAENSDALCHAAVKRLLALLDETGEPGNSLRKLLAHLDNRLDELSELLAGMLARRDLWLRHVDIGGLNREELEAALAREVESVLRALNAALPQSLRRNALSVAKQAAAYLDLTEKWSNTNAFLRELSTLEEFPGARGRELEQWRLIASFMLTAAGDLRKPKGLNATLGFPAASDKGISGEEKAARDGHKQRMAALLADLEDAPEAVALLQKIPLLPPVHYSDEQWNILAALNALMPYAVLALQEVFRDRGEADFPELAIRAREALGGESAPTDLALKLDYRIRHLLVDEFQDTSHSQIDLLLRLTRGWSEGDGRSLFVVGDPMQSIYQFREAEVGHFLAVRENGLGRLPLRSLRLAANFRSQAGVVEWVNEAFRNIFPARDDIASGAIAFEPSDAMVPAQPGKAVKVHAFTQYDSAGEAQRVLELVREALADAENRSTAILVRGRANLAAILPALRDAGIPFQAVELESLESVPVVRDLLALTRSIVNPVDSTALYAVLRAPYCGLRLRDLEILFSQEEPLFQSLRDERRVSELDGDAARRLVLVRDVLEKTESQRGRRSLRERVEAAWLALHGPAVLHDTEELEDARLFFELLQQLEDAGDLDDVNEFDERLKQLFAAPDPQAGESLQVMTLHKAKGLEFDTVIIPALDQVSGRKDRLLFQWIERTQPDGSDQVLLGPLKSREDEEGGAIYRFIERLKEEKESLERSRLLYVGITRAIRRVHLLGKAKYSFSKGSVSLSAPRKGSLLELLWRLPEVRETFEALPLPDEKPVKPETGSALAPLRRLPSGWRRPDLPRGPDIELRETAASGGQDIVFDWAGERVRHIGTLVHRCLENIARDGLDTWPPERLAALPLARQLNALGLPEADCEAAAREVRRAVQSVLASETGRWILAPHEDSRAEWALGGVDRGELVNVSLDRSFVTEGIRWIIDYKTSTHEGGDLEDFLQRQQQRYREQLERYARLVHALEGRPVKTALYFPLQDAFRAWEPELD